MASTAEFLASYRKSPQPSASPAGESPPAASGRTLPPAAAAGEAAPCHACLCAFFWRDAYGNLHCGECRPPRTPAMVRERVCVEGSGADARWRKLGGKSEGWRLDGKGESGGKQRVGSASDSESAGGDPDDIEILETSADEKSILTVIARGGHSITPSIPPGESFLFFSEREKKRTEEIFSRMESGQSKWPDSKIKKIPLPEIPRGAEIFFLRRSGKEETSIKISAAGKSQPADATHITWSGADRWHPVGEPEKAEKKAAAKEKGEADGGSGGDRSGGGEPKTKKPNSRKETAPKKRSRE